MKLSAVLLFAPYFLSASSLFAVDPSKLPPIPERSIALKKELLFADDFEGSERDKRWHRVVDSFAVENGALVGTQTREVTIPAQNGKPEIKAHAAVYGLELPTKDSVIEAKIRFEGATMIDIEFDDRKYTGSHYGHLCRAVFKPSGVTILDEREGTQNSRVVEWKKEPEKNGAAIKRLIAEHSVTYPMKLEQAQTYTVVVETVGHAMRVTIDGKPVAYFESPGIGHPTKSKIELGVGGKSGRFEEIKIWNAEPAL